MEEIKTSNYFGSWKTTIKNKMNLSLAPVLLTIKVRLFSDAKLQPIQLFSPYSVLSLSPPPHVYIKDLSSELSLEWCHLEMMILTSVSAEGRPEFDSCAPFKCYLLLLCLILLGNERVRLQSSLRSPCSKSINIWPENSSYITELQLSKPWLPILLCNVWA